MSFLASVPSRLWPLVPLLLLGALLLECTSGDVSPVERARRAEDASGPIVIGAAWPWESMKSTLYLQGMQLALREVNDAGGVLGRTLTLKRKDDGASVNQALRVAQDFANDPDVVAVIGHLHSFTTLPAATIYDRAGVLLLAPTATAPALTQKGYGLVFRSTFQNDGLGHALAAHVAQHGVTSVAVCYVANEYGRELANAFEAAAANQGVEIAGRRGYSAEMETTPANLRAIASAWRTDDVGAVFFAGEVPVAPMLMATAREIGVDAPFIGGDALRIPQVIRIGGAATEGLLVPYRFHPDDATPEVHAFVQAFRAQYGVLPDAGAALGYDSIRLLAHGMTTARSTVPREIAAALRTSPWTGVEGDYAFDPQGNLVNGSPKLMRVENQRFTPALF